MLLAPPGLGASSPCWGPGLACRPPAPTCRPPRAGAHAGAVRRRWHDHGGHWPYRADWARSHGHFPLQYRDEEDSRLGYTPLPIRLRCMQAQPNKGTPVRGALDLDRPPNATISPRAPFRLCRSAAELRVITGSSKRIGGSSEPLQLVSVVVGSQCEGSIGLPRSRH